MWISTAPSAQLWSDCSHRSGCGSPQASDAEQTGGPCWWAVLAYLCVSTSESDPASCALTNFLQDSSGKQFFLGKLCFSLSDESNGDLCYLTKRMDLESQEAQVIFPHLCTQSVTHKEAGLTQPEFAEELTGSSNQLICLTVVVNCH